MKNSFGGVDLGRRKNWHAQLFLRQLMRAVAAQVLARRPGPTRPARSRTSGHHSNEQQASEQLLVPGWKQAQVGSSKRRSCRAGATSV